MLKSSRGKTLAVLMFILGIATLPGSCSSKTYIGGECGEDDDCHTDFNFWGYGTLCIAGRCTCPNPEEAPCCPNGAESCEFGFFDCRSAAECAICETDAECPGPPDPRCGAGVCKEGKCALEIAGGQPLASQRRGDCMTTFCTFDGLSTDVQDPSDVMLDGNLCTIDICDGYEPLNLPLANGAPYLGKDFGICIDGKYQDCSDTIPILLCPGGLTCFKTDCLPSTCTDNQMNGQETSADCGGPECLSCFVGETCLEGSDCTSGVCVGGKCQESQHDDGVKNDAETGIDCGHPGGPLHSCPDGEGCNSPDDCQSSVCFDGLCQAPTCFDGVMNGPETGIDCGGDCGSCPP